MSAPVPSEHYAAALAGLSGMTPVRLAKVLDGFQPVMAWNAITAGTHPADPQRKFAPAARRTDVCEVGERYAAAGIQVLLHGKPDYPSLLVGDPGAPAVLFALGDPNVLVARHRVAIVGTRSATPYGRRVASELASDLAAEGVVVVSGLARGIDGAAHAGVVRSADSQVMAGHGRPGGSPVAPPAAVAGTGLDVVYPSANAELWEEVASRGVIFSESGLGTKPHPGVFPARNRIIAALSDVVVVVESQYGGGSLYTAEAAARRSIPVCAVPGSVHSPASSGTNQLLVDGCTPVRDATDVLVAVSLARTGQDCWTGRAAGPCSPGSPANGRAGWGATKWSESAKPYGSSGSPGSTRPSSEVVPGRRRNTAPNPAASMTRTHRAVWNAVDETPTPFETILIRTDLTIAEAVEACDQLVDRGLLASGAGWWSKK